MEKRLQTNITLSLTIIFLFYILYAGISAIFTGDTFTESLAKPFNLIFLLAVIVIVNIALLSYQKYFKPEETAEAYKKIIKITKKEYKNKIKKYFKKNKWLYPILAVEIILGIIGLHLIITANKIINILEGWLVLAIAVIIGVYYSSKLIREIAKNKK